jgi:hypothetical protein
MPESLSQPEMMMLVAVICGAAIGLAASAMVWCIRLVLRARMPRRSSQQRQRWEEPAFESTSVWERVRQLRRDPVVGVEDRPEEVLHHLEHVAGMRRRIRRRSYFEHHPDALTGFPSQHGNVTA